MTAREEWENDDKDKDSMGQSHETPQPPGRESEGFEKGSVEEREQESINEMDHEPQHFGSISIGCHHRPEEKRHIHAREAQCLTGTKKCCQKTGCEKSPQPHAGRSMHLGLQRGRRLVYRIIPS